jgi:hypothetical protein
MTTIIPDSHKTRKAIAFISAAMQSDPCANLRTLLRQAISHHDLSPADADFLYRFYQPQLEQKKDEQ